MVWHSWIPTNLGEINIRFFGKSRDAEKNLRNVEISNNKFIAKKVDVSFISDTHFFLSKWMSPLVKTLVPAIENEIFGTVDIEIEERSSHFSGEVSLFYTEYFEANASFILEYTGKIKIDNITICPEKDILWKNFSGKDEFLDYLAQVIFIIIKTIVHGDNHHHQKIDTAIEVKRGEFDPFFILETMIRHIKRVEYDIKNMDRCHGRLKAQASIEELNGYRSYIKTFRTLFIENAKTAKDGLLFAKDPSILDNIIDSAKASIKKWTYATTYFPAFISIALVYVAISISGAILYVSLMGNNFKGLIDNDWTYYFLSLVLLTVLMASHIKCSILSWLFYKQYALFEYLYHLSALENPKRFQDKMIKFILKYYKPFFFLFVALLSHLILKNS